MKKEMTILFRERAAEAAIGPSSVRNQGNKGVVEKAREYLKTVPLESFVVPTERRFRAVLDLHTEALRKSLPVRAKHWGTARKVLNLFLRDILYHRYLCKYYHFDLIEQWLEVPLDKYSAQGLDNEYAGILPHWPGIKYLKERQSQTYQLAAKQVARIKCIAPVHLDICWWRNIERKIFVIR